jgi:hypothetical protein
MINQIDVTQNPFAAEDQIKWECIGTNEKAENESAIDLAKPEFVPNDDFADELEEAKAGLVPTVFALGLVFS